MEIIMEFQAELKNRVEYIEKIIGEYLPIEDGKQKIIYEAMNYSMLAGGKRLRPMIMMETAKLFNCFGAEVKPFMAAMEMIHTYSLVHDDLPAMDNDDYRRGKLTTHKKYGHAMGVLAGDALLNYAYEICAEAILYSQDMPRAARAFSILSKRAGADGMIGGQTVDVMSCDREIDKDTLDFIHKKKTAALLEGSMSIGAVLAGADEEQLALVEKMGNKLGLAFQIQDDILDVIGNSDVIGKPVLSDEKNNKMTYVTLYGVDKAREMSKALVEEAIDILDYLGENEFLKELFRSLIDREK